MNSFRQTFSAFRHRNYRLFWSGFALSIVGTWMQTLAQGWLVWRLTESAMWLGIIGAMSQLPSLLIGSIGGVLVDRTPKKFVLYITQTGLAICALTLAVLTYTETVNEWHILILATLSGFFMAVDAPARLAFVGDLVGKEDIGNAVALNSSTFNGARLVGPSIAGIIVPIFGEGVCFLLNALSYLSLIVTLSLMRNLPPPTGNPREPVLKQLRDAYNFIVHAPVQRVLIRNVIFLTIFGFSYTTLLPMFADVVLGKGASGLGVLMSAGGIGALLGGLWQASMDKESKRGWVVMMGMAGLGLGLLIFSLSKQFEISIIAMAMAGFSGISMLASTNTLLQQLTPDHLRGRVLGFYTSSFLGFGPFGAVMLGVLAHSFGPRVALAFAGGVCLIVASYTIVHYRRLRAV
ncbi:MAG: MFS transporter [bacterium]|nr:MFS transporter [bacterium]